MSDPIATPSDLETLLNLGNNTIDPVRAALLLSLAQDMAEAIVAPLPAAARAVVLSVAARAYANPQNLQQQTTGPYTAGYGTGASGGLYLSRQDKAALSRLAGRSGAFTIDTLPATAGQNLPWWDTGAGSYGFDQIP